MNTKDIMPGYLILLPMSRGGASRNQLVPTEKFSYEALMSSEAYAYKPCTMVLDAYSHRIRIADVTGPTIYLGAVITIMDFSGNDWLDAFPKRYRPYPNEKERYRKMLIGVRDGALAVDRYGHVHLLKEGETVEPMDWEAKPMTVEINYKECDE